MAKKKFELDDFSFDKSLDVPDFDFEIKQPKDNRKPILKVASGVKKGALAIALSNDFAKQMVKKALPVGFGSAYDMTEKSLGSIKSLYDDTTKEIRPFMNDLKRTTERLLPKVEDAMPKKLAEIVKDWTKTAEQNPTSSNYDPREAEISGQMAGMVQAQALLMQKQSADNDSKDRLREGLAQVRHRDSLRQLDATRVGISQLVEYQNHVTANYHRKSLELQYRHYFVAVDALQEAKKGNVEIKAALDAIVHNTALPEQVKLHASDAFKTMAKRQIGGVIGNAILGRSGEFFNNLTANLRKTAVGRVKNAVGMGRFGLGEINSQLDGMDMAEAMGMKTDPYHAGGMAAGAMGTAVLGDWLAGKLKPHLDRIPGIRRAGNKLQYGAENLPQILGEWARSSKHENGGVTDHLVRFLKANVRMSSKLSTGIQKDSIGGMQDASYFSRQNSKTLNEIIPGYMAMMVHELQMIRTGDKNIEQIHYDFTKNKFDTRGNVRKNAFNSLVSEKERGWTRDNVDNVLNEVDPKGTLTPEQRKILGAQLMRNNVRGRLGSVDVLGKTNRYDGDAAQHAEQFSKLFRDHFRHDPDSSKKHSFAEKYNAMGQYASARRDQVQELANLGMTDFLQETGILKGEGDNVDLERFFDLYNHGEYSPGGAQEPHTFSGQPMGGKPQGRKARRAAARAPAPQYVGQSSRPQAPPKIEVKTNNDDLIQAIQANSVVEPTAKMLEAILRLEERINKGLPTIVVGNVADGNIPAAAVEGGGGGKQGKGWWWNRSVKDAAKGVLGAGWGAAKGVGRFANWTVGGAFGALNGATRFGFGLVNKGVQGAFDKMRGFKDVYSDETGPRKVLLFAARLKAGEYFDAKTGKPIKTWKDIQGAVADSSGIVMTEEQAQTAYVKEGAVKKVLKGLGAVIKPIGKLGNFLGGGLLSGPLAGYRAIAGVGKFAFKMAANFANGPQDVYVFDKDHPKRLRKALDAKTMRAGGYSSAVNDKVIKGPKDIDGEVYNYKGVTVLDDEEFKRGLYDKNGNPIRHGIARLLGGVGKLAGAGFGAMKWLAGGLNKGIGNMFGLGKGVMSAFSGMFGRHGIFFGGGRKLMDTVGEIRDLLKDRLPKPHRIRKGSIEDQHLERKEKEDEDARKAGKDGDDTKKRGGILGMLAGLFGRKKKKDGDEEGEHKGGLMDDIESGIGQAVGDKLLNKIPGGKYLRKIPGLGRLFGKGGASAAAEAAESAVGGAAKRGLLSRLGGGLMSTAKFGKGLGLGALLAGGGALASASGHETLGKGLGYAGDAATGWSALSLGAGALGIEGGAMGALAAGGGALLTGLGAILASPVLLPALGVAAVAGAGYLGYRLLTRNKLDDFSKIRYAQYGWKPEDNDQVSKVFGLENDLLKGVVFQGGMAQIDTRKVDIKKAVESFGVDIKDKDQITNFTTWYVKRFKPVFITHVTVLNGIKAGTKLSDVDSKLNAEEKKKYLAGIQMPADPYSVMVSPIPGNKLSAGPDEVKAVFEESKKAIEKAAGEDKDKKPETALSKMGADVGKMGAAPTAAAAAGIAAGKAAVGKINEQANRNQPQLAKAAGGAAAVGMAVGAQLKAQNNAQMGAMEAIRFKTYGLKEMDTDKVSSLRQLEALVQKDVKVNKGKAEWSGDVSDVTAKIAPQFGFSGNRSDRAYDWMTWFHKRFLPTYLTYVSAVCSVTNQPDPDGAMKAIKPSDLLNAAKQVVSATSSSYGMANSVWQVSTSPWDNYQLNQESATTDGNMQSLKQAQKTTQLPQQQAYDKKTTAANDAKNKSQDATNQPSWLDKFKNGVSNAWDQTKAFAGKVGAAVGDAYTGAKDALKSAGSAVSDVVSGAGDALSSTYDSAKKAVKLKVAGVSAALKGGMNTLASLISRGEGNYSIANKPVGGSYPVAKGVDVSKMTIGQIQKAQSQRQLFAVGRYQLIPATLAGAVKTMGLSGDMPFSPEVQDKIFASYLVGSKRPKIAAYLSGKSDDVAGAALAAAQEWASIGTPKGMKNAHGQISDGTTSYYAGIGGNKASISADEIMTALQAARKDGSSKNAVDVSTASAGGTGGDSKASGSSSGGIIKVADQTPGPAPATKGTPPTSSASSGSSTGSSTGATAGATAGAAATSGADSSNTTASAMSGFQNRNKDLAAQSQYQSQEQAKSLGPIQDILQKSYEVQQQMLQALQLMAKQAGGGATPTPSPSASSSPTQQQRRKPEAMPTPPVSMSKMV